MKICFDSAYENGVGAIFNIWSIMVNKWNSQVYIQIIFFVNILYSNKNEIQFSFFLTYQNNPIKSVTTQ